MRKLFLATIIIVATFSVASAQNASSSSQGDIPNMGRAPSEPNGIGRLDARVFDEAGNPVRGAYLKLESERSDGYFCESWNSSDERGVSVLPPLHMGNLTLKLSAKGFQTQTVQVSAASLDQPIRVVLHAK